MVMRLTLVMEEMVAMPLGMEMEGMEGMEDSKVATVVMPVD